MTEPTSLKSRLKWSDDHSVEVHIQPATSSIASRVYKRLNHELRISGQWTVQKVHPILVLNLASNGTGPTLFLRAIDQSSTSNVFYIELAKLHQQFMFENHCFVVGLSEDAELFLVPIQSNEAVFWGYIVLRGVVTFVTETLERGQIPVILDLDNTLILTQTLSTLSNLKCQLSAQIQTLKDTSGSNKELELLVKEQDCVLDDTNLLKMFCEQDQVLIKDTPIKAQHEFVDHEDALFLRPVIRSGRRIFTRIDPLKKQTSMIIRIREGWNNLKSYLISQGSINNHQRFKVWVCTAAERKYALEAWRLLDPGSELIPKSEIKTRIICSGIQQKSLISTFNLGPLNEDLLTPTMFDLKSKLSPLSEGCSEMPMAIIVDDRKEVWARRNQDQIIKITPFNYKDINKIDNEILRLTNILQEIRSNFYFEIFERLEPMVREMVKQGFEDKGQVQDFTKMIKNGSSITRFLTMNSPTFDPPLESPLESPSDPITTQKHANKSIPFQGRKLSEIIAQISKERKRSSSLKRPIDLICETVEDQEESEDEIYVAPIRYTKTKQSLTSPKDQDHIKGITPTPPKGVRKSEMRRSEKISKSQQCKMRWKKEILMSPTSNKMTLFKLADGEFYEEPKTRSRDHDLEDGEIQD